MGYKVDYTSLDALFNNIKAQSDEWLRELSAVYDETAALTASRNMSGAGADSIRSYLETIHGMLFGVLTELIDTHSNSCFLYKRDYQTNIDTGLHAVIEQNELERIREQLMKNCERAVRINDEVVYALSSVSDIFSVSFRDVSGVDEAHRDEDSFISELDRRIVALESRHTATDFAETEALIESASGIIRELQGKGRAYKSNFSPADLASSAHYAALYEAHVALQAKKQDMASSMGEAIKNEEERIKLQQKELAEREKKANTWRWVVTGVCIVGSVAAIALTGGAATPLVIGAISAASGAVIAGTNNLADQYIANGDLSRTDWNSFGKDVVVGGVTGFVTGYAGAAVSGAITTGLSGTSVGSSLLNSSNAVTRIGTGAVIGSVSEVGSGVVSRGAGTFISSGGDLDAAMQDAFNLENIAYDAVAGGVSGGISNAKAPKGGEYDHVLTDGSQFDENGNLKPNTTYKTGEHDYIYTTNEDGFISEVHVEDLELKTHEGRLNHAKDTIGKLDTDDAGHLIADRFGGSPGLDNLTSQDAGLNRGDYKKLENDWAKAIENNQKVSVDISVKYPPGGGGRPSSYDVHYTIDGEAFNMTFSN